MDGNASKIVGVLVALALVIGGVFFFMSSDDEEEATDTSTDTSETTEAEAEAGSTIVDLAVATDDLSTLVTAVTAAGLGETLSDPNADLTVFAPTNAAFGALPEGTLDDLLLPENVAQLTDVLTYHVVEGSVFSTDLSDGQVVETLQGGTLTVSITDAGVQINDANVVTADVEASNGVVHIIDGVLLP